jgi:hypothetical protein
MVGSKAYWRFAVCVVCVPMTVLAGGCSSGGQSKGPSPQQATSYQAAPGSVGAGQTSPNGPANVAPGPVHLTSGIMTLSSVGNKRIYGFIDPNSGKYSEAVTFTIPSNGSVQASSFQALAASPDLTKLAATSTVNGQSAAGWINSSGQFTAVTTSVVEGPFGGNPPSYSAVGFDGSGNFYYQSYSQQSLHAQMFKLPAGATGNPQEVTAKGAQAAQLNAYLNYDGSMQFGCNPVGSWLGPNAIVFVAGGATQIDKRLITGTDPSTDCPAFGGHVQDTPLLPATNTVHLRDAVGNRDGTKVAFFYDDPKQNVPSVYVVGTDGQSQPVLVNLSESDAKKLIGATLLRWS